jgi:electron transfer flavoprotein alpha subunit
MTVKSKWPELNQAKVIFSGGRGFGSKEKFDILNELADKVPGSAIGASRAAIDAGYTSSEL